MMKKIRFLPFWLLFILNIYQYFKIKSDALVKNPMRGEINF